LFSKILAHLSVQSPNKVDVDLVRELANLMEKVSEMDISFLLGAETFSPTLEMFVRVMEDIDSDEMN
jgi:hypothetical protein